MGTDIHAILEFDIGDGEYRSLAHGELALPRDRKLFSAIAFGTPGMQDDLPFPPRGLPPNCGRVVRDHYFIDVDEYSRDYEPLRRSDESNSSALDRVLDPGHPE